MSDNSTLWPKLNWKDWSETGMTVHLFTQIIGKIRLALMPREAQWAQVPFSLNSRGLSSSFMPLKDGGALDIYFDFISHNIHFNKSDGKQSSFPLNNLSVSDFYKSVFEMLDELKIDVKINPHNVEMKENIRLDTDTEHKAYDEEAVRKWIQILISVGFTFEKFRSRFWGKQTPVSFFWGSFDLAQVRFSGKHAVPPPGSDIIYRVAMDAEQYAIGYWPGDNETPDPVFFAYTYPQPIGIEKAKVEPADAHWNFEKSEFFLPYESVRASGNPEEELLKFCQSTYEAGKILAGWSEDLDYKFD